MTWDQLSINKPHLVYIILGGFTSLFMLCSSVIKERLYIGEATVATLCGIIFGPHAANLINPASWGNQDQITEEFSRIVLVVQCFAVGVELPKAYMERHWRSVTFLLVPVMTFGWLITSLFIWGLFTPNLDWLGSLTIAACVTATDPVLASSVVGKGKFAKRVPKHLRDLLSAESGCNDGMAFPFIYLALYIIRYAPNADQVSFHWFCYTILYECIFGAFYGVCVGYIARRAIRYAHEHNLIDRESFLVFYFVLALFCAGSGSILGIDDLLVGFACGVGFSNDGWFTEKTEEAHVSNVIDLLINLTFFVYFGTIIPWEQFNAGHYGLDVWKLVVLGLLVLLFRRIPIMMVLKPVIPDIKTWREALFAGHFGPIGVGAIFVAVLARAELEQESTTPLKELPPESEPHSNIIYLVWPIVCFLVICSIVVHGSSIAVFTLGKHINTLTLTMSYTQANDQGNWMERLPRIQSRSKSSMSMQRSDSSLDEKSGLPPGMLPMSAPGTFLRRQREEDNPSRTHSRASSRHRSRRSRQWDSGIGPGGPISQSAFGPRPRTGSEAPLERSDSDTLALKGDPSSSEEKTLASPDSEEQSRGRKAKKEDEVEDDNDADNEEGEIFEEGSRTIYEDEEGNVLAVERKQGQSTQEAREEFEHKEGRRLMKKLHADENHGVAPGMDDPNTDPGHEAKKKIKEEGHRAEHAAESGHTGKHLREGLSKMTHLGGRRKDEEDRPKPKPKPKAEKPEKAKETRGPARAYQYGNTIIVEDEDGEVIRKYDIPAPTRKQNDAEQERSHHRVANMGRMLGLGHHKTPAATGSAAATAAAPAPNDKDTAAASKSKPDPDDDGVRFTLQSGGRRMSKAEFIDQIKSLDPSSRAKVVENSDAPEPVKREARKDLREHARAMLNRATSSRNVPAIREADNDTASTTSTTSGNADATLRPTETKPDIDADAELVDEHSNAIPFHDVSADLLRRRQRRGQNPSSPSSNDPGETAAERRRRQALQQPTTQDDSDDDGTERVPPAASATPSPDMYRHPSAWDAATSSPPATAAADLGETAAERRRREQALGLSRDGADSDSEDDNQPRQVPATARPNIRFAEQQRPASGAPNTGRQSALRWGKNIGR